LLCFWGCRGGGRRWGGYGCRLIGFGIFGGFGVFFAMGFVAGFGGAAFFFAAAFAFCTLFATGKCCAGYQQGRYGQGHQFFHGITILKNGKINYTVKVKCIWLTKKGGIC